MIPELLIVAVDFYRNPHRFLQLTDSRSPLPAGITDLLAAPGDALSDQQIALTASALNARVDECKQALPFFIKQVLLDSGGDYYRMLGLPRNAEASLVKRHYHYLIRLFHPDRDVRDEKWDELYAPLINEAYSTLRNPQKRTAYDQQLERDSELVAGRSAVESMGQQLWRKEPVEATLRKASSPPPASAVMSPHVKKLAIGLVAVAVIGFALLVSVQSRKPTLRIESGNEDTVSLSGQLAKVVARADGETNLTALEKDSIATDEHASARLLEQRVRSQVRQAEIAVLGYVVAPIEAREPVPQETQATEQTPMHKYEQLTITEPELEPDFTPERQATKAVAQPVSDASKFDKAVVTVPAQSTVQPPVEPSVHNPVEELRAPASSPSGISSEDLSGLIFSLVSSYEAGDLETFVGLFSKDAITTDAAGGREIYTLYKQFFARPEIRKMNISQFSWGDTSGDATSGSGKLLVITQSSNGRELARAAGKVSLNIKKHSEQLKITGMYYKTSDQ